MAGAFPLLLFAALLGLAAALVAPRGSDLRPPARELAIAGVLAAVALLDGADLLAPAGATWLPWLVGVGATAVAVHRAHLASGGLIDAPIWVATPAVLAGYATAAALGRFVGLLPLPLAAAAGLVLGVVVVVALHDRDAAMRGVGLPLQRGQRVGGRYIIQRVLAQGPRSVTFLGRDVEVGDRVVVKQLYHRGVGDLEDREVKALQALAHPNIVVLRDTATTDAGPCLVLEHVAGGDLAARLATRGPLDATAFRRVAYGLLHALAAAHHAGVVHRDVKPANLLLTREGEPKLSDFDVARLPDVDATLGAETGRDLPVGTLRYAAPEQAQGLAASRATDLWSAAATLFEAHTGEAYLAGLRGETPDRLRERIARLGPFDRELGGPPGLRAWFARALDPDPARRFDSAEAMATALELALAPAAVPTATDPAARAGSGPSETDSPAGPGGSARSAAAPGSEGRARPTNGPGASPRRRPRAAGRSAARSRGATRNPKPKSRGPRRGRDGPPRGTP